MPRVSPLLSNVNSGEWSPLLHQRKDLERHRNAASLMQNFIALREGPFTRRPGSRYVNATRLDKIGRLLRFEFSTEQAYQIEATDQRFRFYRNKALIESSPGVAVEVTTPYLEAALARLNWNQSADTVYLWHPDHAPRKLTRASHVSWSIGAVEFLDGPYLAKNVTDTTLAASGTTGSVTVTASAIVGINNGVGFLATDVGRHVRMQTGAQAGWGKITAHTSPTQVTVSIVKALATTSATADWRLGAWSDTTGWPTCGTFHEQRLWAANTRTQPQTVWGSVTADFENMQPTTYGASPAAAVVDDSAITYTLDSDTVQSVQWLSGGSVLTIGTASAANVARGGGVDAALTPSNVQMKPSGSKGSAAIRPVRVDETVLFVEAKRRGVFQIAFSFEADGYQAQDASLLARHMLRPKVKEMAYMAEPWSTIWACLDNGALIACTYLPAQNVTGWHRHPLGGDGKVLSVSVIPGDGQDEVWLLVERTIDGQVRRYVEVIENEFWPDDEDDKAGAWFVDCALSYDGAPATTISGLEHLVGETVQILSDGAVHPSRVVSPAGQIVLDRPASRVIAGLPYVSRYRSLDLEAGAADGTATGKSKRVHRVSVAFWSTLGARLIGGNTTEEIQFRLPSHPMDASPPLFTGLKRVPFPGGWETEAIITIEQEQPLPCTVLAIAPRLTANDG